MSGILSDLASIGLVDLEKETLFESEEQMRARMINQRPVKETVIPEKDLIYDKVFTCPVCDMKFRSKVMKTGKARFLSSDLDLRPKYAGIDANKYDVYLCEHCGNAMLSRSFGPISVSHVKLLKEKICTNVQITDYRDDTYGYEQALERYKVALACSIVRQTKNSERAYICLKMAWMYRGLSEQLEESRQLLPKKREEYAQKEQECLKSAFEGFMYARGKENYPICGMDVSTLDYLLAAISYETGQLDTAAKMVADLLVKTGISVRTKDKARDLKDLILEKKKG